MKKYFIILLLTFCFNNLSAEIHIRLNQLGYLPNDIKQAVILSDENLLGKEFEIVGGDNQTSFKGIISNKFEKSYNSFNYNYLIDFSDLEKIGNYKILVNGRRSYSFKIGYRLYNDVVKELMKFFRVQRCGYTNPKNHEVCHIADATMIIDGNDTLDMKLDLTGGWHDAGDYVKFLNTAAYTTYTLLFAYEFDKEKFGFDYNSNGVPDILEEAKIGLDWLLRCNFDKYKLISHVQDLRDHTVGWRMPENDAMTYNRPAYVGIGKNLVGIYTATMSLAARIWKMEIKYDEFANRCLTSAENIFSVRESVPNLDESVTGVYQDNHYWGKLALGAVELYKTTRRSELLDFAKEYADSAGSDYWWSWGNLNSYAHYRIAEFDKEYIKYIQNNLEMFNEFKSKNIFGMGTKASWGTNNTLLGITLQYILWNKLTNDDSFKELALSQRDFVLGKNPWGISFINKVGSKYSKNFHHQIGYMQNNLPGGFAAGPISRSVLDSFNIPFETADRFRKFQTDSLVYRDDRNDYVTNEPTIAANATAVFVFGWFSRR